MRRRILWWIALAAILVPNYFAAAQGPHAGTELTAFVVADRFAGALQALAPRFQEETGIRLNIVPQGYPELYQRAIADFVGGTAEGDLYSVDVMWSGEWAQASHLVDLAPLIALHADEIDVDDIMPVMWNLGGWGAQQIAFPLAGYAGVLSYNREAFEAEGVAVPTTIAEWQAAAATFTGDGRHGIVMNGARGAPVAQDWMYYMLAHGGRLLDADGRPTINAPENVASLDFFATMFDYAPPGASSYAWGDRELAFRDGRAMMQMGWSTGVRSHNVPEMSQVVGKTAISQLPMLAGEPQANPFGGWGIGINRRSPHQEAAWSFILWLAQPEVRKEFVRLGGEPIRRSTLTDPEILAEFPWYENVLKSFETGDGDFRPRIPQYARMQETLGLVVNQVIIGELTAQEALDRAQAQLAPLFR